MPKSQLWQNHLWVCILPLRAEGEEHSTRCYLNLGGSYLPISFSVQPSSELHGGAAVAFPNFPGACSYKVSVQVVHSGYALNLAFL